MTKPVWLVCILVLSGCDYIFGLTEHDLPTAADANDVDTTDAPLPLCAGGTQPTRQIFPAVADAMIGSGTPNQNSGLLGVATVSSDLGPSGSRGLFRFQIGALDASAVLELQLVLPSATKSDDCATSCGPCIGIERGGTMRAFPARANWVENEVTWNRASNALAWQSPGATGPSDGGGELAPSPNHAVGADTVFVADAADVPAIFTWIDNARLSFVVDSASAKQVVRTNENTCDGGASSARLEILACK